MYMRVQARFRRQKKEMMTMGTEKKNCVCGCWSGLRGETKGKSKDKDKSKSRSKTRKATKRGR
jgi:hypothetical protein